MNSISHTAEHALSEPALLSPRPMRRSLLDRLDSPAAVFAVLGAAAVAGLALAFGVVRGLQHLGNVDPTHTTTASEHRKLESRPAAPRNDALAKTLAPELQYQVLNSSGAAPSAPAAAASPGAPASAGSPGSPASAASPGLSAPASMEANDTGASVPAPSLGRFKLTAPYIPPIARTARSMPALAKPPRAPLGPSTTFALPGPVAPAKSPAPPVATLAPPRLDIAAAEAQTRNATPPRPSGPANPAAARRLNDEANRAFWIKQDLAEALQLERRAYEANPSDVEIAGNLAFYYLKQSPPHAEAAREVALRALNAPSRYGSGRLEDWMSLGVANALTGRRREAEEAFITSASAGNNVERACRGALNAVVSYGEAVRPAAIALLRRVNEQGRSRESPYCAWPPNWTLGRRYP